MSDDLERRRYHVIVRNKPVKGRKVGSVSLEYETEPMTATAEQLAAWLRLHHKGKTVEVLSPHPPTIRR